MTDFSDWDDCEIDTLILDKVEMVNIDNLICTVLLENFASSIQAEEKIEPFENGIGAQDHTSLNFASSLQKKREENVSKGKPLQRKTEVTEPNSVKCVKLEREDSFSNEHSRSGSKEERRNFNAGSKSSSVLPFLLFVSVLFVMLLHWHFDRLETARLRRQQDQLRSLEKTVSLYHTSSSQLLDLTNTIDAIRRLAARMGDSCDARIGTKYARKKKAQRKRTTSGQEVSVFTLNTAIMAHRDRLQQWRHKHEATRKSRADTNSVDLSDYVNALETEIREYQALARSMGLKEELHGLEMQIHKSAALSEVCANRIEYNIQKHSTRIGEFDDRQNKSKIDLTSSLTLPTLV
ncbi:MAG: hypothetical protein MHM6MM_005827 [Cercozoa sp. M6MM]